MREKLVFTFPGQGSFDRQLLRNLYASQRALRALYYAIDEAAGEILGVPFLPMVWSDGAGQAQGDAGEYRDLDQLGIYLANYATARLWLQRGVTPDRLIGHSFGELAAFAVAGIYVRRVRGSLSAGVEPAAELPGQERWRRRRTAAQVQPRSMPSPRRPLFR
jgi:acyl transferase domain-containing protein